MMDRTDRRKLIRSLERQARKMGGDKPQQKTAVVGVQELRIGTVHADLWPVSLETVEVDGQVLPVLLPTSRVVVMLWGGFRCMVEGCDKVASVQHVATQIVPDADKVTRMGEYTIKGQVITMHGYICLEHAIKVAVGKAARGGI